MTCSILTVTVAFFFLWAKYYLMETSGTDATVSNFTKVSDYACIQNCHSVSLVISYMSVKKTVM